jgi:hypothetical protein
MLSQNLPTMPMMLATPMETFMLQMLPTIKVLTTIEIRRRCDGGVYLNGGGFFCSAVLLHIN